MACPDDNVLAAFVEGSLASDRRAELHEHLAGCAACRALVAHSAKPLLPPGSVIDRYVVLHEVGAGAMGVVFAAWDKRLARKIALKVLHSGSDPKLQERLAREARALAKLSHPNVLAVYDAGVSEAGLFIAIELVEGQTLRRWLEMPRAFREKLRVYRDAGRGLAAAHAAGLVHRDFKPDNVLVAADGRVRVSDFGMSRLPAEQGEPGTLEVTAITNPGIVLGTPGYMAPEVIGGAAHDARSDQYGFCAALWEALYSVRPFSGLTAGELLVGIQEGRFNTQSRRIDRRVVRALKRGLSADPALRFPSMEALLHELRPRPRWPLRAALGLTLAAGLVAAVTLTGAWRERKEAALCRASADGRMGELWNPEQRKRAADAFVATGRSFAPASWDNAQRELGAYASAWTAARVEACDATRVRREQTERQLQLRFACLDRRVAELEALLDSFGAPDTEVVDNAHAAVARLSPIEECAQVKGLEKRAESAPGEAAEQLSRAIAKVRVLVAAGRLSTARERLTVALESAHALQLPAPLAEVELARGELEIANVRVVEARGAFEQAVRFAEAAGDDRTAATALTALVSLVGWRLSKPDEGRALATIASGKIDRIGGDARLEAELAASLGDVEWKAGHPKESLASYRAALDGLIALKGERSPEVAQVRMSIGWVLVEQDELDEARSELERSRIIREQTLGADHPSLAASWNALGYLADMADDGEEAMKCLLRSTEISRAAVGADSPAMITPELNLAQVLAREGRAAEGQKLLEHAEGVLRQHPETAPDRVHLLTAHSTVSGKLNQHADAIRYGREALALIEKVSGKDHPDVAGVALILAPSLSASGRQREALEMYDRYLRLSDEAETAGDPEYATALSDSAAPLLAVGRTADAMGRLERAVSLLPVDQSPRRAADARYALAEALWRTTAARSRACAVAAEAQQVYAKARREADASRVERWLAAHPCRSGAARPGG